MKRLFISAAVVAASVFGVYTANQNNAMANLSALQMENLELLAEGESSQSFTNLTGCEATTEQSKCLGKDGRTYSFAKRP